MSTMGDSTRKPARIFSSEREIPHIRLADESAIDSKFSREKIGQGSYGIVYKAINMETKEVVAIKVINREKAGSANIKLVEREIGILKSVSHDGIIRLNQVYETQNKMFLIMEYCDRGELSELLQVSQQMDESTVKIIMKRLAAAIAYLHINGVVHRDLKLENILVATNPSDPLDRFFIKVTDFGLSVVRGGMGIESMLLSFCGTPAYMAPEIIQNKGYSESCDNWAIGCITFALLTGQLPFLHKDEETLYEAITNHEPEWDMLPKTVSNQAKLCLKKMLSKDPANRMTAGELLRDPWITGEAGSGTPNVLDLMHDFLTHRMEDEDDGPVENDQNGNHQVDPGILDKADTLEGGSVSQNSSAQSSRLAHSSKTSSSNSLQKSPSDQECNRSHSKPETNKRHIFDSSLPASPGTRHLFHGIGRTENATAKSTATKGASSNNLHLPANNISKMSPKAGGNQTGSKSKKTSLS